ncbi:hypothetical protein EGR_05126 [Echinococcus granulosus]|uniref:Uncharacterized protein n=1 Tax=Echinococcus granulosus TaxID=6210 RepID=W6UEZ9_ECHGR|nr:hypothetical protein EGR_05126 [Echinococcus granulosus]EUB59965.1 hypothetical protein EGR_05126 [Echinococcus granulosus]
MQQHEKGTVTFVTALAAKQSYISPRATSQRQRQLHEALMRSSTNSSGFARNEREGKMGGVIRGPCALPSKKEGAVESSYRKPAKFAQPETCQSIMRLASHKTYSKREKAPMSIGFTTEGIEKRMKQFPIPKSHSVFAVTVPLYTAIRRNCLAETMQNTAREDTMPGHEALVE